MSLEQFLPRLQAIRFSAVACLTIITWEVIVCFIDEYRVIWKRKPGSVIGISYLITRYAGLTVIIVAVYLSNAIVPHSTCQRLNILFPILNILPTISGQLILSARSLALWSKHRTIFLICGASLAVEFIFQVWGATKWSAVELPEGVVGCFGTIQSSNFGWLDHLYWAMPVVVDGIVFVLTGWKLLEYAKMHGGGTPIYKVMMRDGILYFSFVFMVNMINLAFVLQDDFTLAPQVLTFSITLSSIICCRSVLNLRVNHGPPTIIKPKSYAISNGPRPPTFDVTMPSRPTGVSYTVERNVVVEGVSEIGSKIRGGDIEEQKELEAPECKDSSTTEEVVTTTEEVVTI